MTADCHHLGPSGSTQSFVGSFLWLCLAMNVPSLKDVFQEWDASEMVREHMRVRRCLFACEARTNEPSSTIKCAERNFEVLKPLAKRLRMPDGTVGQIKVPHVLTQSFDPKFTSSFFIYVWYCFHFLETFFVCVCCYLFGVAETPPSNYLQHPKSSSQGSKRFTRR